jgi:hypothetical protein
MGVFLKSTGHSPSTYTNYIKLKLFLNLAGHTPSTYTICIKLKLLLNLQDTPHPFIQIIEN